VRVAALLSVLLLVAACQSQPVDLSSLPEGDAARGEALFEESVNGAPTCASCHALTDERRIGPGMAGYADVAGERVEDQSAEEYTYVAIMNPAQHIVEGYTNLMYTEYRTRLSDQQTADLMAYMLTFTQ